MTRRPWTRDELLIAFNLYCKTPFGRLHRNNPDIVEAASRLGRTPSAVAMKLVNFASLDPTHQQRNVSGLRNASRLDREIFHEFSSNWEELVIESEEALERITPRSLEGIVEDDIKIPEGPTDRQQLVRVRIVQGFFRAAVLASYENQCSMCGITISELLNASHIIPWRQTANRRADPTNGIALCGLHDRAFDRGLVTISDKYEIIVSDQLRIERPSDVHRVALIAIAGSQVTLPHRFRPDPDALKFHRQNIFRN